MVKQNFEQYNDTNTKRNTIEQKNKWLKFKVLLEKHIYNWKVDEI